MTQTPSDNFDTLTPDQQRVYLHIGRIFSDVHFDPKAPAAVLQWASNNHIFGLADTSKYPDVTYTFRNAIGNDPEIWDVMWYFSYQHDEKSKIPNPFSCYRIVYSPHLPDEVQKYLSHAFGENRYNVNPDAEPDWSGYLID